MVIGIQDEILRIHALGFLKPLLMDKTTKTYIKWATDAYETLGPEYMHDSEIRPELITDGHSGIIKTRARKELEQQSKRTRTHAEVFTPLWVCNKMNNFADEEWFGKPDVFNKDGVPTDRVEFPEGKGWKEYIDSRRLEITCGEAPYLVSRYDVSNGESIRISDRIGILDRKLRVVNENAESEEEWLKWAVRAFEATYGYEFQGDNLLIARVNLLMTFEEYLDDRWHRKPTKEEYQRVIKIITWNLWQMDGLTGAVPYSEPHEEEEEFRQMSIFDYLGPSESEEPVKENKQSYKCKVFDWRSKCSMQFNKLSERSVRGR